MKIAVDVDGVLAEQVIPVLKRVNDRYDLTMKKSDVKRWDESIPGTSTDIKSEIEKAHNNPSHISDMPIIGGARDCLSKLDQNHSIIIATSRTKKSNNATKRWLESNKIPYMEYINTNGESKSVVDADLLIDDYPNNIVDFCESDRFGILFSQPWNQSSVSEFRDDYDHIDIANSWYEVFEIINNIEG